MKILESGFKKQNQIKGNEYKKEPFENIDDFFQTMIEIEKFFGEEEELKEKIEKLSPKVRQEIFEMFRNADKKFRLLKILESVSFSEKDREIAHDIESYYEQKDIQDPLFIQNNFIEKARKITYFLKKTFLIGISSTIIGYISAYQFRDEYPSETIHKIDKDQKKCFEQSTKEILFLLEKEFIYKIENDREENSCLTEKEKNILRKRFQNFISDYLDNIEIEFVQGNEDIPFYYKLSGANPNGYVSDNKIHIRPTKLLVDKKDSLETYRDYDTFISEASHHLNNDLNFFRYINIPMDIMKNGFDQRKTYQQYDALEYQAHSITERAIKTYLEQDILENEIPLEKIYKSFFYIHKSVIDNLKKRNLFSHTEEENYIIKNVSSWIHYKLSQNLSHIDSFEETALQELETVFIPFIQDLKEIEKENNIPFEFDKKILFRYLMKTFETKKVFPEKINKEEVYFFVDNYFVLDILSSQNLSKKEYSESLKIYKKKIIDHLRKIKNLDLEKEINKELLIYTTIDLIHSILDKKEMDNDELSEIIPILFGIHLEHSISQFSKKEMKKSKEVLLRTIQNEKMDIERRIIKEKEYPNKILKNLSLEIKHITNRLLNL